MVFQSYALYPHMTVAENMSFNLKLSRKPKEAIQIAVGEAARMLGLEELLQRRPAHLSGGQRQRVAMGRAVVRKPTVFLFDEPLSNLDAKLRVQMRAEIKILHQRVGTTSIYVTHDQIEAMTLADRIVVLNAGRIEQVGTPLELYRNPANLFVAGFIGSPAMNFLDAVIRRRGAAVAELADGSTVALPEGTGVAEGQEVVIGLRPENLALAGPGTDALGAGAAVRTDRGADPCAVFGGGQGHRRAGRRLDTDLEWPDPVRHRPARARPCLRPRQRPAALVTWRCPTPTSSMPSSTGSFPPTTIPARWRSGTPAYVRARLAEDPALAREIAAGMSSLTRLRRARPGRPRRGAPRGRGVGLVPPARRADGRGLLGRSRQRRQSRRPFLGDDRLSPRPAGGTVGPAGAGGVMRQDYDSIVVGAGAGGLIAAAVLAESGRRVLLLERGPQETYATPRPPRPSAQPAPLDLRPQCRSRHRRQPAHAGRCRGHRQHPPTAPAGLSEQRRRRRRRHAGLRRAGLALPARGLSHGEHLRRAGRLLADRLADLLRGSRRPGTSARSGRSASRATAPTPPGSGPARATIRCRRCRRVPAAVSWRAAPRRWASRR